MKLIKILPAAFLLITSLASFTETNLAGVWIRKTDHLRIKVTEEASDGLLSFIIDNGTEKFPCEVGHLPIYKNIKPIGRNLWSCDFLVVTMGSCATDYEAGMIQLKKNGDMEITCPGFEKKIYSRLKPRYDGE
jgi:hypothetical protein